MFLIILSRQMTNSLKFPEGALHGYYTDTGK